MRIGLNIKEPSTVKEFIDLAEKNGFQNIEVWMNNGLEQKSFFNEFKSKLSKFQVTAHYPLHNPRARLLFSRNSIERRVGVKIILESIQNLKTVDAELYVVHAGIGFAPIKELEIIRDKCKENGMELVIENGVHTEFKDLTKLRNLCRLLDVGMCYDICHAFRARQNIENLSGYGDTIKHVHLSDVNTKTDHIGLGDGLLPLPKAIRGLKKIGYDNTIVLELGHDPDVKNALIKSKRTLEELWSKFL